MITHNSTMDVMQIFLLLGWPSEEAIANLHSPFTRSMLEACGGEPSPDADGEALARHDPHLGGEGLEQHGREIGQQHDPEQRVTKARPRLDIGREIAGVHIGYGGDDGGACEGQESREAATTPDSSATDCCNSCAASAS